jgi:hypothetical protein
MAVPTVTVTIATDLITGPMPYGRVRFELTGADISDSGLVLPSQLLVSLDANGAGTAELWPNVLGTQGTQYRVTVEDRHGDLKLSKLATVPNEDCTLISVLDVDPPAVSSAALGALAASSGASLVGFVQSGAGARTAA